MKTITVVTPVYNEDKNIEIVYEKVKKVFNEIDNVSYKHLFIDNDSIDKSQNIIRSICEKDKNVQAIFNRKDYGHIKSPYYAITACDTDAVIFLVADLQDPPELIKEFVESWINGEKLIVAVKKTSKESKIFFLVRKIYYFLLNLIADEELQKNFLGFGLFDKEVVNYLKSIKDPEPYLRGLVIESGFKPKIIEYDQNQRERNFTKNNFFTLYDLAMIGITAYSKWPLRIIIFLSFFTGLISFVIGISYGIAKLLYWETFQAGISPLLILVTLMFSIIMFFLGFVAEYILAIHIRLKNRPLVKEKERINF
tara:strand:- start:211 stop:1140 length:930 start_codon:yes stop_codon:yes gene_type:complete